MLKQIITSAIAFIAGLLSQQASNAATLKEQAETIRDQADTIENLRKQVNEDSVDDEALQEAARVANERAAAAEAKLEELNDPELQTKANELAELLNKNPDVPSVDPVTFETQNNETGVSQPTEPA